MAGVAVDTGLCADPALHHFYRHDLAIGLLDYSRWVKPKYQAVSLEARPHPDLVALLRTCGTAVIWRTRDGFASTHPRLIT